MTLLPSSLRKWQTYYPAPTITSASLPTSGSIYSTFPPGHAVLAQSPSCVWFFVPPWTAARQASLSLSHHLPEFTRVHAILLVKTKPLLAYPRQYVLSHSLNKRHWSSNFPFSLLHYQFFSIWSLFSALKHWNDICYFLLSSIKTLYCNPPPSIPLFIFFL